MNRRRRDREYWLRAAYVRRRRRQASALRLTLSTELGASNPSEGGLPDEGAALISAWNDGVSTGTALVVLGRVVGTGLWGTGARALLIGGRIFSIGSSLNSGGLR